MDLILQYRRTLCLYEKYMVDQGPFSGAMMGLADVFVELSLLEDELMPLGRS